MIHKIEIHISWKPNADLLQRQKCTHTITYSNWKITQLSSVESHCVDCLSGPEDSMKPPGCNSNNCPAFQGFRKHLDP